MALLNYPYYLLVQLLLLILLFGVLIYFSVKYARVQKKLMEYLKMLESLAQNHASLSQQFERNLAEREQIIKELVKLLDERIETAKKLVDGLEKISETVNMQKDGLDELPRNPEHEKIVRLARKGLSPRRIAQHFQKPLGEIELILGLYGIPVSDDPSD